MATQPEPEFAKHSVHTDALETLGTLIDEHQGRDAIHLAVEPVVAGEQLFAGAHVGILEIEGQLTAFHANPLGKHGVKIKHVGVVDPFLETAVEEGQRFWLVVYPRVITSLRHVWTHPDFPNLAQDLGPTEGQKAASKAWIEAYAEELSEEAGSDDDYSYGSPVSYDDLMTHAETWCHDNKWGGDHLSKGGTLEGVGTKPEFWDHFKVLTGKEPIGTEKKPNFFSCSC